ncbi:MULTISPECIES: permease prefix domain 1-containing protein [Paenibacillus]|uniref:Permease prefix domain 1-containing protein n=1 Tax=Paenibacillus residui TaxID=629724 RepID=A0ABW3DCJ4_9BACL|nr:permease prefix domain 1-containing protein [Paenibacillus sp. 32O-W]
MSPQIRKLFSLCDVKYGWVLLGSSALFGISNYFDQTYINDPIWVHISYWFSFAIAVLWGVLNYISHVRLNSMYKKQNDIQKYVNQLAMSEEDKLELQTYLEDYVQDLIQQGKTEDEAAREAINQFKVKEFLSLSKNTMFFNLSAHYYLIGWTTITVISIILAWLLETALFPDSLVIEAVENVLAAYSIGLLGMFFLYKLIDAAIYQKFKEVFE